MRAAPDGRLARHGRVAPRALPLSPIRLEPRPRASAAEAAHAARRSRGDRADRDAEAARRSCLRRFRRRRRRAGVGARPAREASPRKSNLGYVVDGTTATTRRRLPVRRPRVERLDDRRTLDFATTRAYGFWRRLPEHAWRRLRHRCRPTSTRSSSSSSRRRPTRRCRPAPTRTATSPSQHRSATWFDRSGFEPRAAVTPSSRTSCRSRTSRRCACAPASSTIRPVGPAHVRRQRGVGRHGPAREPLRRQHRAAIYTIDPACRYARGTRSAATSASTSRRPSHVPVTIAVESLALTQGTNTDSTNHLQVELT